MSPTTALAPSTTGNEDFTSATGSQFTLDMIGPDNSGLTIVAISYGGMTITAAPYTFIVAPGTRYLFLHFEALIPGARLQVVEVSEGIPAQILEIIDFDPGNPGTGYYVTGQ